MFIKSANIEPSERFHFEIEDCSPAHFNKDIAGKNIKHIKGSLHDCCGFCKVTPKCKAYSWNDMDGGTCWLKSDVGPVINKNDVFVGVLDKG
uniref:Apple domain-containing protein n=2 Tax=Panagrolaimus TaxID=55784 RepID=A0A914PA24_9BILA